MPYIGVDLNNTNFIVGSVAMVTCSSDDGVADRIEIISEAGRVDQASVETLTLTINPVTDSLHNTNVICTVTRNNGMVANQILTITVDSKQDYRLE